MRDVRRDTTENRQRSRGSEDRNDREIENDRARSPTNSGALMKISYAFLTALAIGSVVACGGSNEPAKSPDTTSGTMTDGAGTTGTTPSTGGMGSGSTTGSGMGSGANTDATGSGTGGTTTTTTTGTGSSTGGTGSAGSGSGMGVGGSTGAMGGSGAGGAGGSSSSSTAGTSASGSGTTGTTGTTTGSGTTGKKKPATTGTKK
jgi:hypothetical protein